jgi:D-alanyl-D-alanine-carboxypeptidase/D-alanyl-D-alanine-endopeptidase
MRRMKHYTIIALISLIAFQCQNSKQKDTKELPAEVVETIEKRIANGVAPSMALALIDSSGTHYFNFGKTENGGKEVDENTIYEIGSISKVFTGILLAQQILDDDLKMDDKVNDLLPDSIRVPVMGEKEITLGNLTDHTSGLPRDPGNLASANPNNPYADYTVEQMYEFISNYQPIRAVGSKFEYSNIAQGLLGHLLAMNKNTSYEHLMVKTIANPLKMNDTRIEFTKRMKENLALGHSDGKVVDNWDIPTLAGAGAIRSSTTDMAKFISANLAYGNTPLLEAMELSHKLRHKKAGGIAMAWHIKKGENGDVIWHNGGTGGYRSFAGFVKETGKGVILLTNSSAAADDIGFYLLDPGSELDKRKFASDAIELPESTLEQYVGLYEMKPESIFTITKEGTRLFGHVTGQERFEIYPENDTLFFLTVVEADITFQLKEGNVESLMVYQGGKIYTGNKIE